MFNITITLSIIIITGLISIAGFRQSKVVDELIFWPPAISKKHQYYRFITCGLIHADYMHLIFNMLTLYFFGTIMEAHYQGELGLQKWYYLALYIGALIVSNIPTYIKHRNDYELQEPGRIRCSICRTFCFYSAETLATDYCYCFSGSGHHLWRVVSFLFSLYVQKRRRSCKSRCTFLWSFIWYFIYNRRQAGCD